MRTEPGKAISAVKATLRAGDISEEMKLAPDAKEVVFNVKLKAGKTRLFTHFEQADGTRFGAYFVYVKRK